MELFIIRDGQQTGPFNEESVQTLLKSGGLRPDDMGWHKGLPAWLPLGEFFQVGPARTEPPPVNVTSGIRSRPATGRQKALLQYIGAPISAQTTRDEAALAISDALENPKLTSRFAKWGEEKLRLHPDLFQEEVDYRRANRISRFLELCQTDGSEVVKDITKAHVQVLIESLDKRQPGWDDDARTALWDYLLPSVAEHFPQLLQEEWKGKLKFGGSSKVAAAYAGMPTTGMLSSTSPAHPSALQAVFRGVIYGGVALGLVLGGIHLFRDHGKNDIARTNAGEPAAATVPAANEPQPAIATPPGALTVEANAVPGAAEPVHPTKAPLIGAEPKDVAAAPQPAVPPTTPPAESNPPAPTPAPAPAPAPEPPPAPPVAAVPAPPAMNAGAAFTPAPVPPGATPNAPQPAVALDAPAAPIPAARDSAVLTQPVTVQLQFGKVTLNPGTRLRLIALEGANARVNFNNNIVLVPVASTDIDPANTVVAATPTPTVTLPAAPLTPAVPTANVPTPAPTSSLAPKPLPSADL